MEIEYEGIWHQPNNSIERTFYDIHDFDNLLKQAFSSKQSSVDDIVKIYQMVMGVKAYIGNGPDKKTGLWIETEMERFKCTQCGNCCLNLYDAFCTTAHEEDLIRWEEEYRFDILEYIHCGDLWISPRTGHDVTRCPWLRKLPNKEIYICRIHDTKPKHCREYPRSKKHALRTGCKGFN